MSYQLMSNAAWKEISQRIVDYLNGHTTLELADVSTLYAEAETARAIVNDVARLHRRQQ